MQRDLEQLRQKWIDDGLYDPNPIADDARLPSPAEALGYNALVFTSVGAVRPVLLATTARPIRQPRARKSRPASPRARRGGTTARSPGRPQPEDDPPPQLTPPRGLSPRQALRLARNGGDKHVHIGERFMREWFVMLEDQGRVVRVADDRWQPLHPEGGWWRAVGAAVTTDLPIGAGEQ